MSILQANNISYRFDNGDELFSNISVNLNHRRIGLLGRNGVGKSVLISILNQSLAPQEGQVISDGLVATFNQELTEIHSKTTTIAGFLEVENILEALEKIAEGVMETHWYDTVGDQWQLKQVLTQNLTSLSIPTDLSTPCHQLSGGQLTKLGLWKAFNSNADFLLLDEPSNHLDTVGKDWLENEIANFSGRILIISHDRRFLRNLDQILELTSLGINKYGGGYDEYFEQKRLEVESTQKKLEQVQQEKNRVRRQSQLDQEKADQRAAQGKKLRKQGSQPKVLLDAKKDKATASTSNRSKNASQRESNLQIQSAELAQKLESQQDQRIYIDNSNSLTKKDIVSLLDCKLPYGVQQPLTMKVKGNSKVHIQGENGCGKSTLYNVIEGTLHPRSGECRVNTPVIKLDQHFTFLIQDQNLLENMSHFCEHLSETESRTLLAGIGFRRDAVYKNAGSLSGGEKMKLAVIIISHQKDSPLILLDEPDNHLDLDSKIQLAAALRSYEGAFLLISHDLDFVTESGVTEQCSLSRES